MSFQPYPQESLFLFYSSMKSLMIRACFPLLLPHDVKVKRIWLLCIHELLWEVGRGAWQSCWDVDFLATGGIIWALEQCAQQGCSHQHQEKHFLSVQSRGLSPFPLSRRRAPARRVIIGICGWWRTGDPWCERCDLRFRALKLFTWCLCLHWKAKSSWGPSYSFTSPSVGESLTLQHKNSWFFFPVWSYFPRSVMRWSPRDLSCIIQLQKLHSPFLL